MRSTKKKYSDRLSLAIELPRFAREQILQSRKHWRKQLSADVRWTPPLSLHLSLRYLGELNVSLSKNLSKRLTNLVKETPIFQLSLKGVGASPSEKEAEFIFLEFSEPKELSDLEK